MAKKKKTSSAQMAIEWGRVNGRIKVSSYKRKATVREHFRRKPIGRKR